MVKLDRDIESIFANDVRAVAPFLRSSFLKMGFSDELKVVNDNVRVLKSNVGELRILNDFDYGIVHSFYFDDHYTHTNGFYIAPDEYRNFGLIYSRTGELAKVLVTSLHEFGHLFGKPLANAINEEARAYSFSRAGISALVDPNLRELRERAEYYFSLRPDFLKYPEHNRAHTFVSNMIDSGINPLELYELLCAGNVSVSDSERFFRV